MADESAPTLVDTYARTSEATRSAARWVISSLSGVAALLVAGLGLSSLSHVQTVSRLLLGAGAVVVALVGVIWAIAQTAALMKPATVTYEDIVAAESSGDRPEHLKDAFARSRVFLQGLADNYTQLRERFSASQERRGEAWMDAWDHPSDKQKTATAEAEEQRMKLYRGTMLTIVANAGKRQVAERAHTAKQLGAAALVLIGVLGFALILAWPTKDIHADLHGAKLERVDLNGVRLAGASFTGMSLKRVRMIDADLRGADFHGASLNRVSMFGADTKGADFGGAKWRLVTCPDGALSDRAGGSCTKHMVAAVPGSSGLTKRCRRATVAGRRTCIEPGARCRRGRRANAVYRRFGVRCARRDRLAPG
jgi:hypothetical protein